MRTSLLALTLAAGLAGLTACSAPESTPAPTVTVTAPTVTSAPTPTAATQALADDGRPVPPSSLAAPVKAAPAPRKIAQRPTGPDQSAVCRPTAELARQDAKLTKEITYLAGRWITVKASPNTAGSGELAEINAKGKATRAKMKKVQAEYDRVGPKCLALHQAQP